MPCIFISYVNENRAFAEALAQGLERAGYSTWYYTRNSVGGLSYMSQINAAIMAAQVVALVISKESLAKAARSKQVTSEVMLAHESNKNFFPVLLEISWDEFAPQQPEWRQALAGTVGIEASAGNVQSVVDKILAGLRLLKIEPDLPAASPSPGASYPMPLALALQRALAQQPGAERAYARHQDLQELAFALLQFISAAALSAYLCSASRNPETDRRLDAEFADLDRPMYETWLAALALALESLKDSADPLARRIDGFYFDRRSRQSPAGEAIVHLQRWLGLRARQRSFVSHDELFELLGYYLAHPQGWAAGPAEFPPDEFEQRANLLYAALSAALDELMGAGGWELAGALEADGKVQRFSLAGAAALSLTAAASPLPKPASQHVYLLRVAPEPALDLFPWLRLERCRACGALATWALASAAQPGLHWVCQRCGAAQNLTEHAQQELARLLLRKIPAPQPVAAAAISEETPPPAQPVTQPRRELSLRCEIEAPLTHAWPAPAGQLLAWDESSGSLFLVQDGRVAWSSPQRFLLRFVRSAPGSALAAAWDGRIALFQGAQPPTWLQADGTIGDACRLDSLWIAGTWKKDLFSIDSEGRLAHMPQVNEGVYRIAVLEQSGWLAAAALDGGVGLYQEGRKVLSLAPFTRLGSLAFAGRNLLVEAGGRLHTLTLSGKELSAEALAAGDHFELCQLPGSADCLLLRNRAEGQRIDASGRRLPFFNLPPGSRLLSFCSQPGRILVAPQSGGCALWQGSREICAWKDGQNGQLSHDGRALAVVAAHHAALYEVDV